MKNLSLNLALIEDDPIFSNLIFKLAENDNEHRFTVKAFSSASSAIGAIKKNLYDLFLVDLGLPDMDGVDVIRYLNISFPETPIMVLSVITSESTLLRSIQAGARGYVSKNESNESILKSIKEALKGNFPISPMLARYLFKLAQSTNSNGEKNIKNNLSAKEMEILYLIADGKEYMEIAKKLKVAISTIQTHIRKLYKKLNAHSKTQAILKARESGILN